MPVTLSGIASAITSRITPTIQAPASADVPSDVSNNQPEQGLLNFVASLLAHAGLLDIASSWTAKQTFTGGADIATANVTTLNVSGAAALSGTLAVAGTTALGTFTASSGTASVLTVTDHVALTNNPSSSTGISNQLNALNLPKAWVNFHTDGSGHAIIDDAFNVSGVTLNGGADFTVNFATAMGNSNYAALCLPSNVTGEVMACVGKTNGAAHFYVTQYVDSSGSGGSHSTWTTPPSGGFLLTQANKFYNVVIFGRQ